MQTVSTFQRFRDWVEQRYIALILTSLALGLLLPPILRHLKV